MFTSQADEAFPPDYDFDRWVIHRSSSRYGRLVLGILFGKTTQAPCTCAYVCVCTCVRIPTRMAFARTGGAFTRRCPSLTQMRMPHAHAHAHPNADAHAHSHADARRRTRARKCNHERKGATATRAWARGRARPRRRTRRKPRRGRPSSACESWPWSSRERKGHRAAAQLCGGGRNWRPTWQCGVPCEPAASRDGGSRPCPLDSGRGAQKLTTRPRVAR